MLDYTRKVDEIIGPIFPITVFVVKLRVVLSCSKKKRYTIPWIIMVYEFRYSELIRTPY